MLQNGQGLFSGSFELKSNERRNSDPPLDGWQSLAVSDGAFYAQYSHPSGIKVFISNWEAVNGIFNAAANSIASNAVMHLSAATRDIRHSIAYDVFPTMNRTRTYSITRNVIPSTYRYM